MSWACHKGDGDITFNSNGTGKALERQKAGTGGPYKKDSRFRLFMEKTGLCLPAEAQTIYGPKGSHLSDNRRYMVFFFSFHKGNNIPFHRFTVYQE